jgi:hypothetical protein
MLMLTSFTRYSHLDSIHLTYGADRDNEPQSYYKGPFLSRLWPNILGSKIVLPMVSDVQAPFFLQTDRNIFPASGTNISGLAFQAAGKTPVFISDHIE